MNPIDELRALVVGRRVLEARILEVATGALKEGADRTSVAFALGISRASLYRRFGQLVRGAETESVVLQSLATAKPGAPC